MKAPSRWQQAATAPLQLHLRRLKDDGGAAVHTLGPIRISHKVRRFALLARRLATGQGLALLNQAVHGPHGFLNGRVRLTALHFHGLTTQLPRQVWIAMPRDSHSPRIDFPPIRMVQMASSAHLAGVEEHLCNGVKVRIYSPAKTVVDCFKHRNKIGLDVALEALKDAWRTRKASADDLWRYAQDCRVVTVMPPYMEAVAHE
jgi:hypothetical protein